MKSTVSVIFGGFILLLAELTFAQTCVPTPLANGNFETGKIKPWLVANEYLTGLPAVTITETAYKSNYAANLSLIYQPSDAADNHAPLINILQRINACSAPQTLSLWYNIRPGVHYHNSFLVQLYDGATKEVYVYKQIFYNGTDNFDSRGKKYGEWYHYGPWHFQPKDNTIIFSLIVDGSYNESSGRASILVDDVNLSSTPD